ncbi:FecR family protein [bacterium A37T11]|nr:FecR family protein [bacterium A37T11]
MADEAPPYILELAEKWLNGSITPEEKQDFDDWYHHFDFSYADYEGKDTLNPEVIKRRVFEQLLAHMKEGQHALTSSLTTQKNRHLYRWTSMAAAILIAAFAAIYYFHWAKPTFTDIAPGYNQATLTLADGTTFPLDSAQTGIQIGAGNIRYNDGTKLTAVIPTKTEGAHQAMELSLSTPRGGQYQVILCDGTKVWLNAASTLKYPYKFNGDKREVFLEGEAYFSVNSKDAKPFIVKTREQSTTVLGTEFNLAAYADEASVKTTLINGAVRVLHIDSKQPAFFVLAPGEQSILVGNKLTKQKTDVEVASAWKNGQFDFTGKNLEQVMRELERWYDFTVIYEGSIPEMEFYGKVYRNNNLSDVLEILKGAKVRFRIAPGRKLIIENNKKGVQPKKYDMEKT